MQARPRSPFAALSADGLPFGSLCLMFLAALLLIFSRRPGDLLHAQFYAEDGTVWFAQAYRLHWVHALLVPDEGYLHLLARTSVGPALLLPLRWAPLWLNLVGACVQALPIVILLSPRSSTWGPLWVRLVMAFLYLASPNTEEIHVTLTNAQWHFALVQFLLAFGKPPKNRLQEVSDVILFLIGSCTGPFGLVLLPLLLLFWWRERQRWTLVLVGCLAIGAVFQLDTMMTGTAFGLAQRGAVNPLAAHKSVPLGATPSLFVRIVGGNLFLDSLVGFVTRPYRLPTAFLLLFLLFGVVIVASGAYWGPRPFRYFCLYGFLLFAAALKRPLAWDNISAWHALSGGDAMRYCFLPMLVFVWSAVYAMQRSQVKVVRFACLALFLLFLVGLRRWSYLPYRDHHFATYAQQFGGARPGSVMDIPLQPDPWFMTLIKR